MNKRKINNSENTLSKLECQVAYLSQAGLKRWEIAKSLGIQPGTVKSQLERVKAKLGPEWKEKVKINCPEIAKEVKEAVQTIKEISAALEITNFAAVRKMLEGELSLQESAILYLQGLNSKTGKEYLRKARSVQWQLIRLNGDRLLYVNAGARFWLKPALTELMENRSISFLNSDMAEDPYRPWWLPYISKGRTRATRAANYEIKANTGYKYVGNFLTNWIDNQLELYVTSLYTRMQQRWQALHKIAIAAGREAPESLPALAELLAEARAAIGN
ncbi:MAG: hypothetical protein PWP31_1357 [Clostridia bacterium]|nr:hypothetical protein [Clostridia bacterium]MDK2901599.1 hypothetical protein [Thermosediminibacterales bacterium]